MNTITLNGISSLLVKGLLIQELPPIVKPKIRTVVEEVDGRDGDIVTKLGYSAYDKEAIIGLHGDYDVDQVIYFFNSEGEVIFSNEPDKYYKYEILDEIEFERLLRFKKAKVKFHVQPFKYSAVDNYLDFNTTNLNQISIMNDGNTISKPVFTIHGSGTINLSINGAEIFVINLGNEEYIAIDSAQMNAYKDGVLKNRLVSGDYENLNLSIGNNVISWVGNVTRIEITDYSRWI